MDDSDLVEQAKNGHIDAYEQLMQRYQDLAFRTAYLIVREAGEAEDAAQDAFVKAYYALPRFRTGAPFRPWLLRIVANEARNRRQSANRRATLALRAVKAPPTADDSTPEAAAIQHEQRALLLAAIDQLRAEDRHVIAFRYFADLSEAEMADLLGIARGTVKSRLSRALARLRARLLGERAGEGVDRG